jgi:hypothetical protein
LRNLCRCPDDIVFADVTPLPTFSAGVTNLTVTSGRNAQLTCKVDNLGNYKVTIYLLSETSL